MAQYFGRKQRFAPLRVPTFSQAFSQAAGEGLGRLPFELAGEVGGSYLKDLILPSQRQSRMMAEAQEGRAAAASKREARIDELLQGGGETPGLPEKPTGLPQPRRTVTEAPGAWETPFRRSGASMEPPEGGFERRAAEPSPAVPPTPRSVMGLTPSTATTGSHPSLSLGRPDRPRPPLPMPRDFSAEARVRGDEARKLKAAPGWVAPKRSGGGAGNNLRDMEFWRKVEADSNAKGLAPQAAHASAMYRWIEGGQEGQKPELSQYQGQTTTLPGPLVPTEWPSLETTTYLGGRPTIPQQRTQQGAERVDQGERRVGMAEDAAASRLSDQDKAVVRSKESEAAALEREALSSKTPLGKVTPEGEAKLRRAKAIRAATQEFIQTRVPK